MRRKLKTVPNARSRAFVYACSIIALSIYAIPRIPSLHPGIAGTFSSVWILFAVLALASNVYFLVGADKERSQMLAAREVHASREAGAQSEQGVGRRRRAL